MHVNAWDTWLPLSAAKDSWPLLSVLENAPQVRMVGNSLRTVFLKPVYGISHIHEDVTALPGALRAGDKYSAKLSL